MEPQGLKKSRGADRTRLEALNQRVRTLLPEQYQDSYEDVQPVSMGSAALKYGPDGKVAWNKMWGSFCDLAMAGGPPHKGTLLEPATQEEINAEPDKYRQVAEEICRGIELASGLSAEPSPNSGWIRVACVNKVTAEWLLRAITMENVSVRREGTNVELPAGPSYRLEKEIKNVITVTAKTCHYWFGHTSLPQRYTIRDLLAAMDQQSPLLRPAWSRDGLVSAALPALKAKIDEMIKSTGLRTSNHQYSAWLGIECGDIPFAIWMMRSLVASNVLSRREGTAYFVPVDPVRDPDGEAVVRVVSQLNALTRIAGVSKTR